jgi:hypothetical protein
MSFWMIILTLLGLPWILGYAMLDTRKTLIFSYLFTIINSSQGTIVFIFHCIISSSVREELIKLLRKQKKRLLSNITSSSNGARDGLNGLGGAGGVGGGILGIAALNGFGYSSNSKSPPHLFSKQNNYNGQLIRANSNSSSYRTNSNKEININRHELAKLLDRKSSNEKSAMQIRKKSDMIERNRQNGRAFINTSPTSSTYMNSSKQSNGGLFRKLVDFFSRSKNTNAEGAKNKNKNSSSRSSSLSSSGKAVPHNAPSSPYRNYFGSPDSNNNLNSAGSGNGNANASHNSGNRNSPINENGDLYNLALTGKDLGTLNSESSLHFLSNSHNLKKQPIAHMYFNNDPSPDEGATNHATMRSIKSSTPGFVKRTSSQMSSSSSDASNNKTQTTYTSPIASLNESSANNLNSLLRGSNSRQVPVGPPPPLPGVNQQSHSIDLPNSTSLNFMPSSLSTIKNATTIGKNNSFKTSPSVSNEPLARFTTFKSSGHADSNSNRLGNLYSNPMSTLAANNILNNMAAASKPHKFNGLVKLVSSASQSPNPNTKMPATLIEQPIIATNHHLVNKKKPASSEEENQYLTPEYHSYSMVDSEFQSESQYYCDDGICDSGRPGVEDDISNNYVEVMDEFIDDQDLAYFNINLNNNSITSNNNSNNNNNNNNNLGFNTSGLANPNPSNKKAAAYKYVASHNQVAIKSIPSKNNKNKLKDLISMPEEYDQEEPIESSNISEQDLFNLTSEVNKSKLGINKKSGFLSQIPSSLSTSSTSEESSSPNETMSNSTLGNSPVSLNQHLKQNLILSINGNSEVKKILESS